jgi:hypothetical protein
LKGKVRLFNPQSAIGIPQLAGVNPVNLFHNYVTVVAKGGASLCREIYLSNVGKVTTGQ